MASQGYICLRASRVEPQEPTFSPRGDTWTWVRPREALRAFQRSLALVATCPTERALHFSACRG
jgi:hypothetical protein